MQQTQENHMAESVSREDLKAELHRLYEELGDPLMKTDMTEHGRFGADRFADAFGGWSRANYEAGLPVNSSRSFSDEEAITDLQRIAEKLEQTPTLADLKDHGLFPRGAYQHRFGTYNDALREAGLNLNHRVDLSDEELIAELRRVGDELGRTPTADDIESESKFSVRPYLDRWETLAAARDAAGVPKYSAGYGYEIAEDTLLTALQEFAEQLGRTPWSQEMMDSGPYSKTVYQRHFGSWNEAVKEAGLEPHGRHDLLGSAHAGWKGGCDPYGTGWNRTKRQTVRDRDNNECVDCGMSSNAHREQVGVDLHVHHIIPARQFDDPVARNGEDNLVTLCSTCHKKWEGIPLRPDSD